MKYLPALDDGSCGFWGWNVAMIRGELIDFLCLRNGLRFESCCVTMVKDFAKIDFLVFVGVKFFGES